MVLKWNQKISRRVDFSGSGYVLHKFYKREIDEQKVEFCFPSGIDFYNLIGNTVTILDENAAFE